MLDLQIKLKHSLSRTMNQLFVSQPKIGAILFIILALIVCGVGGAHCHMSLSQAESPHTQSTSHQSPFTEDVTCPDLLNNAGEAGESADEMFKVFPLAVLPGQFDGENGSIFTFLKITSFPQLTSYPLLFLLFSVFLN